MEKKWSNRRHAPVCLLAFRKGMKETFIPSFLPSYPSPGHRSSPMTAPHNHIYGKPSCQAPGNHICEELGEPSLVDLKVVGLEMAPSIGHRTDPKHPDHRNQTEMLNYHWITVLSLLLFSCSPQQNCPLICLDLGLCLQRGNLGCKAILMLQMRISKTWAPVRWRQSYTYVSKKQQPTRSPGTP